MIIILKKKSINILLIVLVFLTVFIYLINFITNDNNVTNIKSNKGYVAIVIDDFGNNGSGTEAILNMPIPITAAVMPFQPYSKDDAEAAYNAGLEVILHVPMEANRGKPSWLGANAITCNLSDIELKKRITEALEDVPWVVGMNNHMGSKATADKRVMKVILEFANQNNLFFLDSKTTPKSVVSSLAPQFDVMYSERDVFLDGTRSLYEIKKQLEALAKIALKKGYAVGIGHVGKEGGKLTAEAINSMYSSMQQQGVQFVFISDIVKLSNTDN